MPRPGLKVSAVDGIKTFTDMSDQSENPERAQLFVTVKDEPQVLEGHLRSVDDGLFIIQLDKEAQEVSGSAVLYFPETDRERALTVITRSEGTEIHCQEGKHISPDKRAFPRLYAGIKVLYQTINPAESVGWYEGTKELEDNWHHTDEYMNFSVTGLAFEGSGHCACDDLLALRISVGNAPHEWRALAKPVRSVELKDYEQETLDDGRKTVRSIAVSFESIPDDCALALTDLTNRVLDRS
jgi:hypothetical protein